MKEIDKAYIAGFVDGDGCITITQRKWKTNNRIGLSYIPVVEISNCDVRVLDWIISKTEGIKIYKSKYVDNRSPTFRPQYRLFVGRMLNIEKFLILILPYLKLKKEQAEIVLLLINHKKNNKINNKEYVLSLRNKIHYLNRRGPRENE